MTSPPPEVARYLARRAVSGPWRIDHNDREDFRTVVVIPALAESATLPGTLATLACNPPERLSETLVLVVVNHRTDSAPADKADNLRTLRMLTAGSETPPELQLAWVNAASGERELAEKDGGVGLARKIGFDLALSRLDYSRPNPLLVSLDADTLVGPDYLDALRNHFHNAAAGGAVLPFCHRPGHDPAQEKAIARYELFLRAHVLGLQTAKSPYAFHTIGSTMACRASAYVAAGGMNRRRAGEDFYFLQQLAKTAGVVQVSGSVVHPSGRPSARTPFGTGRSVEAQLQEGAKAILFYPFACYRLLGQWLRLVASHVESNEQRLTAMAFQLHEGLFEFLERESFPTVWKRLVVNHPRPDGRLKAFHDWFDGLKTTRLIHHLCTSAWPRCHPEQALPPLLAAAGLKPTEDPREQLSLLRRLQGVEPERCADDFPARNVCLKG
ncbi:MAG: glycosyltransferase family 2 protein [Syntrophotaleaceae bacterium]